MVTSCRTGRGGNRVALMMIVAAALAALVVAWAASAQAQTSAPPVAQDAILSRHLHLLTPQEPTPEGILAPERSSEAAAPLLRRLSPAFAEGMEQLPPFFGDTSVKLHL